MSDKPWKIGDALRDEAGLRWEVVRILDNGDIRAERDDDGLTRFWIFPPTSPIARREAAEAQPEIPALPSLDGVPDNCEWLATEGEPPYLVRGDDGSSMAGMELMWANGKVDGKYADDCNCHSSPPCHYCTSCWSDEAVDVVETAGRSWDAAQGEPPAEAKPDAAPKGDPQPWRAIALTLDLRYGFGPTATGSLGQLSGQEYDGPTRTARSIWEHHVRPVEVERDRMRDRVAELEAGLSAANDARCRLVEQHAAIRDAIGIEHNTYTGAVLEAIRELRHPTALQRIDSVTDWLAGIEDRTVAPAITAVRAARDAMQVLGVAIVSARLLVAVVGVGDE
jgi:hypothetical protein